ncbi:cyclophilin-like fold protein [Mycobacterium sp. 29Ha]|uniref:cyclophilin-like fold protein n=1 Tax=Mycobacterium sp. 29Ha TaxID=2939268 RepID=UPI002938EA7D|nr:cyclophilin-like fold protein [Mycobacterium sp. 29Ha]MDV3133642.1 cyclophilin-like fold protein [Mycobacterium sp. 29Ha]
MKGTGWVLLSLSLLAIGCSNSETDNTPISATGVASQQEDSQAPVIGEIPVAGIRLEVGGQRIAAQLADNPTAIELAAQLPMTLSFRDLNAVEKIARLPRPLTMDGVPAGDDPQIGDIGYYAPSQDLVLYYGDVGYWNGIVRIGRFDAAQLSFLEELDGFDAVIEAA